MSKSRSGAPKRVAAGLLAGALTVVGLAFAPSAGATATVTTDRYAGTTRYGTAAAIAGQSDFNGATTAILATGENFPDALAASGIAGANGPAPIVLTQSGTYTQQAKDALNALTNVTKVTIVGGTAAISDSVKSAVEADGFTVTRVAGTNRFGTAAAIAAASGTIGQVGGKNTALIANGLNYPDALAGGTVAYDQGLPILLVTPTSIPSETASAIDDLNVQHVIILGGTAAVGDSVKSQLETSTGSTAERIAGVNRFGTAAAVGDYATDNFGWDPTEIELASGVNFPDALAGGPLGGERQAPIILTASVPDESKKFADDHSDTVSAINCLGGTAACSEADLQTMKTAAQNIANDGPPANNTATTRPELVSAAIRTITASFSTTSHPAGTYVTDCFDEPVTGATADETLFFVYAADGTDYSGDFANAVSGQPNCVEVAFGTDGGANDGSGDLDTAAEASTLTLATVDDQAVQGQAGASDTNIEGDSPLTPAGSTSAPSASGITSAPDLITVGGFRPAFDADHTAVDFTFDEVAFGTGPGAGLYHIVTPDGLQIACDGPDADSSAVSGGTQPGGEGTVTHTAICPEPTGHATFSADTVVRGYVDSGTVSDSDDSVGHPNPLEAADVSAGGNSDGPDLASVIFSPDAVPNADIVAFIYDEAVQAGVGFGHAIYTDLGAENPFAACSRSTENNAVVLCGYADGTLSGDTYVGGNVPEGTVMDLQNIVNVGDEVGATPSAGPSRTSGKTDGPDLTGVAINTVLSPLGSTTYTATYTFDEDIADTGDATKFDGGNSTQDGEEVVADLLHLYTPDGIQLSCDDFGGPTTTSDQALANRTEDQDATVTCTHFIVALTGVDATQAQIHSAVVGTVDFGAADDETAGGDVSPEGAEITTGGNGTAAS